MTRYVLSDFFPGNYRISQYFGERPSYYKPFGLAGHEGIDFAIPVGVDVLVPFASARVLRAAWDPAYGYYLVLWDPAQLCAVWYCHLSKLLVTPGQIRSRFAVVGKTGRTGNASGAHLHVNFCETDRWANRLNRGNGYQGFMNMLKPGYIAFRLSK